MEEELRNLIKVWLTVFISLCYCYTIGKIVSKGPVRLILLLPIICLFLYLPLKLSSVTLIGFTSFFIAWLANFKLLLFAFGKGPLGSDHSPSTSLGCFVAISCLPIKIQQSQLSSNKPKSYPTLLNYAIKALVLALIIKIYDYIEFVHPKVLWFLYCFYIYFFLELILALIAGLARALTGFELEPQFNEPYLSSSLQDFWGKRWNLMVTSILRPSVYEPTLNIFKNSLSRKWASIPAVMATFMVSAIMHELVFYHMGRLKPNWNITMFFVIHGLCLVVEIVLKMVVAGKWRLPRLVSGTLTIVFVFSTCFWLFLPELLRFHADVKMFEEYRTIGELLKNVIQSLLHGND